jgi:hypothetical protein
LRVEASEAYAISPATGGDRWQDGQERTGEDGEPIAEAEFDLAPFRGSYCRVTVVDPAAGVEQPDLAVRAPHYVERSTSRYERGSR